MTVLHSIVCTMVKVYTCSYDKVGCYSTPSTPGSYAYGLLTLLQKILEQCVTQLGEVQSGRFTTSRSRGVCGIVVGHREASGNTWKKTERLSQDTASAATIFSPGKCSVLNSNPQYAQKKDVHCIRCIMSLSLL